jgi:hypothetical protein
LEKIEKQVASGEPEGPLNRYLTKQNVLGVIAMAVFVAGVWIMRPASSGREEHEAAANHRRQGRGGKPEG